MAIIHVDGMPYTTIGTMWNAGWNAYYGNVSVQTGGRFGGRYLYLGFGNASYGQAWGWRNFTTSYGPTIYYQLGFYAGQWGSYPNQFFLTRDATTTQFYIEDYNGAIRACRGDGTVLGTSVAGVIPANQWVQIECKVYIHHTAGTVDVRVNGVSVLSLTDKDTNQTSNTTISGLGFAANGSAGMYISDLILFDDSGSYVNTWLGSRRVIPGWPTANGNYAQWTPSAGSNYQCVDETDPSESDYNATTGVNNIDTFAIPDISNTNGAIDAVVPTIYAKNSDAGLGKLKGVARSSSVDGLGPEVTLADSGGFQESPIYVDPNTGVAFTVAGFNAAEFGYKRTA